MIHPYLDGVITDRLQILSVDSEVSDRLHRLDCCLPTTFIERAVVERPHCCYTHTNFAHIRTIFKITSTIILRARPAHNIIKRSAQSPHLSSVTAAVAQSSIIPHFKGRPDILKVPKSVSAKMLLWAAGS